MSCHFQFVYASTVAQKTVENKDLLSSCPQLFLQPYAGTNAAWPCGEADWEPDHAEK